MTGTTPMARSTTPTQPVASTPPAAASVVRGSVNRSNALSWGNTAGNSVYAGTWENLTTDGLASVDPELTRA
ncbi:hypothetical protein HUG10_03335 [Halorarum halophilum]|uniref:Uncharacterized protein n=1 Tax=Halorarum halophilum TaxID=2743090 RepID=A0A7D5GE48_9EURY|nr:hypothetical protein [Halobaculum halophilum]QLG26630.1 hypothetical protein HUG10_03335 [Halobaculum halophilum]